MRVLMTKLLRHIFPTTSRDVMSLLLSWIPHEMDAVVAHAYGIRSMPLPLHFGFFCAKYGYVSLLNWAFEEKHLDMKNANPVFECAAVFGQLSVMQWIQAIRPRVRIYKPCRLAIKHGQEHIVLWILENRLDEISRFSTLPTTCVRHDKMSMLKLFHNYGVPLGDGCIRFAVLADRPDYLEWLLERHYQHQSQRIIRAWYDFAVKNDRPKIVAFLRQKVLI